MQKYSNLFFLGIFNIRIPLQILLTQRILFTFLLSFLKFSTYYKFRVIKMNAFISLFLAIGIMLRNFFVLHISRSGTFLHSTLKTYLIFQSSSKSLLLCSSEISVFANSWCIYAILSVMVFNFSTSTSYNNILLKCEKILNIFASTLFIFVI